MASTTWWIGLGVLAAVVVSGLLFSSRARATETLMHGPFELLAEHRRISDGRFPNTSANPFGSYPVTWFRVRHRGQAVAVAGVDGSEKRFVRALRVLDAPKPALLVVSDGFHLVTEEAGALVVRPIGEQRHDSATLQWLDAQPGGQPGPEQVIGIEQVSADSGTALAGGRWLRLSFHSVLDVQTLQVHAVRPWTSHDGREGGPPALHGAQHAAVSFAPGRSAYAVTAHGRDAQGRDVDGLVVVDLASGDATALPLDRRHARYADMRDVTPAWVAHHFRWQRNAAGQERLALDASAKPLPWRGRLVDFSADQVEYQVQPVSNDLLPLVLRFFMQKHGVELVADGLDASRSTLKVPGCGDPLVLSYHEGRVTLYAPSPRHGPTLPECRAAVRRLGAAFDAELAGGRYDSLFTTR